MMGNNRISMSSMVVIVPRPRFVHVGDIALPATGEAIVKTATDRFGRLDVLFNNAGMLMRTSRFRRYCKEGSS